MLTPEEFQALLRAFPPLAGVQVKYVSPLLMPWQQTIFGAINVYGVPHYWEVEVDVRRYASAEDIMALASKLIESHEQAAAESNKGTRH